MHDGVVARRAIWWAAAQLAVIQLVTLAFEIAAYDSLRSLRHMLGGLCEAYCGVGMIGFAEPIVHHLASLTALVVGITHGVPIVLAIRQRASAGGLREVAMLSLLLTLAAFALVVTTWLTLVSDLVRLHHETNCFCAASDW